MVLYFSEKQVHSWVSILHVEQQSLISGVLSMANLRDRLPRSQDAFYSLPFPCPSPPDRGSRASPKRLSPSCGSSEVARHPGSETRPLCSQNLPRADFQHHHQGWQDVGSPPFTAQPQPELTVANGRTDSAWQGHRLRGSLSRVRGGRLALGPRGQKFSSGTQSGVRTDCQ